MYEADSLGADESDGEGDDEEVADASTLFVAALFNLDVARAPVEVLSGVLGDTLFGRVLSH